MRSPTSIEPGDGRTVLLLVAHADDAALFLGGTIIRWANAGWRVVCARVTDDRWDSVGLNEAETIARNAKEFRQSARVLGIEQIVELNYRTDVLGDESEVALRAHFIGLIRRFKPYALVTFDPYAMYGEDNQDHLKVAAAADEAFWTSQFDLHHPEHFTQGLVPHGAFERWYFGREVTRVTDVIDIGGEVLERKLEAALSHETMLRNFANQLRLQATSGGWEVPMLDRISAGGPLRPFVELIVRGGALAIGHKHGVAAAEEFRVVRFGGMQQFLNEHGRKRRP